MEENIASPFKTFYFMGQLRYQCPQCGFDSYSLEAVEDHLSSHQELANEFAKTSLLNGTKGSRMV